jgi:hypothetical protein
MPFTGSKCPRSGIYEGNDPCHTQIALSKDETFPPCSGCRKDIDWTLKTPTE